MTSYIKTPIYILIFLSLLFGGCKSHKKHSKEQLVVVEDVIEVKPRKKKEKKKGQETTGELIARESISWIGTPYGYGRSEKGVATDCSGMVLIIYRDIADIKLPRNSAEQAKFCHNLKESDIEAGDLVFFATGKDKNKVSHVGIMIDKNRFVHASGSKGVMMSEMTTPYYRRTFLRFGRVPGIKK